LKQQRLPAEKKDFSWWFSSKAIEVAEPRFSCTIPLPSKHQQLQELHLTNYYYNHSEEEEEVCVAIRNRM
jgi:hypothetical protein